MFALIRFLDDFDKKEYTVPVKDIKDFYPANEQDFSRNKVYTTLWVEEDNPENNGTYPSQVLLLASSKEELEKKRGNKRLCRPIIHPSDVEADGASEADAPASQKQAFKQGNKKARQIEADSKRTAYKNILNEHLTSVSSKNEGARAIQVARKKRVQPESESGSGTDDDVVSLKELKRAKSDARYWRCRYEASAKENA